MKKILLFLFVILTCESYSQVVTKFVNPIEIETRASFSLSSKSVRITMSPVDTVKLLEEDEKCKDCPIRFGYGIKTDFNLVNSGTWSILPNGDKIWALKIFSPGAYSLNLRFDKFFLADGAELYIYNKDKTMIQGPYTSDMFSGVQSIGSDLLAGDEIILEYIEPYSTPGGSFLHINKVVHGYKKLLKSLLGYGDSGSCNININCSEGDDWQDEADGVAMVIIDDDKYCTGALLNNTCQDYTPYFLTAFHCIDLLPEPVPDHLISTQEILIAEAWYFRFQFKSPTCDNSTPSGYITYYNCTYRASYYSSDFALVELENTPENTTGIKYLGWSRYTDPDSTVSIHHPCGDVMKISYDSDAPANTDWLETTGSGYWRVVWDGGITEGGSSGAPLFDDNQRVIGQLKGGYTDCSEPDEADWFGAFDYSWGRDANNDPIQERNYHNSLYYYLDPCNSGDMVTNTLATTIPYITGSDLVCYSSNQVFTLHDRLSGTTVSWTKSYNLDYVSGQSTDSFTVKAPLTASGAGWVQANISTDDCDNLEVLKTIENVVGSPYVNPSTIEFECAEGSGYLCTNCFGNEFSFDCSGPYNYFDIKLTNLNETQTIDEFTITDTWGTIDCTPDEGTYKFMVRGTNDCGTYSNWSKTTVDYVDCGFYLKLYPNPTIDETTISIQSQNNKTAIFENDEEWRIEVYTQNQLLILKESNIKGETYTIKTADWKAGIYYVRVYFRGKILTNTLIVIE